MTALDLNRIAGDVKRWKEAFDKLGLTAEEQERIFYKNAAHIFGLEG